MIYAAIPVSGREILLYHTIARLSKQTTPVTAVCCGHTESEKIICENAGAIFIQCPDDTPLGEKWQKSVELIRDAGDAEAILILGSANFICNDWVETLMNEPYQAVGVRGLFFFDIRPRNATRLYYWPGYTGPNRKGEPIGTGRIIKRELLDKIGWEVYDRDWNSSLDYSMTLRIRAAGEDWFCTEKELKGMDISTYRWKSKHDFRGMVRTNKVEWYNDARIAKFIPEYFPEVTNLFNDQRS